MFFCHCVHCSTLTTILIHFQLIKNMFVYWPMLHPDLIMTFFPKMVLRLKEYFAHSILNSKLRYVMYTMSLLIDTRVRDTIISTNSGNDVDVDVVLSVKFVSPLFWVWYYTCSKYGAKTRHDIVLTHLPLVPYICVSKSNEHWFR